MRFFDSIPFTTILLGLLIGGSLGAALGYYGQCTSGMCPLTSTWWRGMLYGGFLGLLFAFSSGGDRSRADRAATPAEPRLSDDAAPAPQSAANPETP